MDFEGRFMLSRIVIAGAVALVVAGAVQASPPSGSTRGYVVGAGGVARAAPGQPDSQVQPAPISVNEPGLPATPTKSSVRKQARADKPAKGQSAPATQ